MLSLRTAALALALGVPLLATAQGSLLHPPAPQSPPPVGETPPQSEARPRRYQIEHIIFHGLERTRESEVRRHLLVTEGDLLDDTDVLLSRLRLLQLGWFSRVEARVERGSERGLVTLVFDVTERNTLLITDLVLGSTGPQPIYGGLGLSQQNFLGRGLGLSGAFVYGGSPSGRPADPSRFALRAAFFAPDLAFAGFPRIVAGASALWLRGEELTCADSGCDPYQGHYGDAPRVQYERAGGEMDIGFRPGPFERLTGGVRFERVRAVEVGTPLGPAPFHRSGNSLLSALTGTYELDTRDDFFLPREGWRGVAQITFASRLLGGDYEYSRYLIQIESAFSLLGRPLRFQGAVGAVQGDAPFFDRFYAADFMYFAVGPALGRALELNFSTDSRYDAFVAMGGLEWAVPLWSKGAFFRRGYLALGARAVYSSAEPGAGRTGISRWPFSAEAALRLDTPVGVFNLSMGYALDNVL
jgi:outer membrane protein insertion porin family